MNKLTILFFAVITIVSCNGNKSGQSSSALQADPIKALGQVKLNNGAKWKANLETKEGIEKMQKLVAEYMITANNSNDKLSESLNVMFDEIIEKCTMDGPAHDQLHNYLLPLKAKIDQIKVEGGQEKVSSLQYYLAGFHNSFE